MEKDRNAMNSQELRELADKLEAENEVVKVGYLKDDLYDFKPKHGIDAFWLVNPERMRQLIENYVKAFKLALKKGTKFECFIIDGQEAWFDAVNYGLEDMDSKWAETYLENIG